MKFNLRIVSLICVLIGLVLLVTLSGCDSVDPNVEESVVVPTASVRENCYSRGPRLWDPITRYYREVGDGYYEVSYETYQALCRPE